MEHNKEHQIDLSDQDAWDDTLLIEAYERAIHTYQVQRSCKTSLCACLHLTSNPSPCTQDAHYGDGNKQTAANGRGKQYIHAATSPRAFSAYLRQTLPLTDALFARSASRIPAMQAEGKEEDESDEVEGEVEDEEDEEEDASEGTLAAQEEAAAEAAAEAEAEAEAEAAAEAEASEEARRQAWEHYYAWQAAQQQPQQQAYGSYGPHGHYGYGAYGGSWGAPAAAFGPAMAPPASLKSATRSTQQPTPMPTPPHSHAAPRAARQAAMPTPPQWHHHPGRPMPPAWAAPHTSSHSAHAAAAASSNLPTGDYETDLSNLIMAWYHCGFFTAKFQERYPRS